MSAAGLSKRGRSINSITSELIANGCDLNPHWVAEDAALLIDSVDGLTIPNIKQDAKKVHMQNLAAEMESTEQRSLCSQMVSSCIIEKAEILISKEGSICQNQTLYWTQQPSQTHVQMQIKGLSKLWMYSWTPNYFRVPNNQSALIATFSEIYPHDLLLGIDQLLEIFSVINDRSPRKISFTPGDLLFRTSMIYY